MKESNYQADARTAGVLSKEEEHMDKSESQTTTSGNTEDPKSENTEGPREHTKESDAEKNNNNQTNTYFNACFFQF